MLLINDKFIIKEHGQSILIIKRKDGLFTLYHNHDSMILNLTQIKNLFPHFKQQFQKF